MKTLTYLIFTILLCAFATGNCLVQAIRVMELHTMDGAAFWSFVLMGANVVNLLYLHNKVTNDVL